MTKKLKMPKINFKKKKQKTLSFNIFTNRFHNLRSDSFNSDMFKIKLFNGGKKNWMYMKLWKTSQI